MRVCWLCVVPVLTSLLCAEWWQVKLQLEQVAVHEGDGNASSDHTVGIQERVEPKSIKYDGFPTSFGEGDNVLSDLCVDLLWLRSVLW